MATQNDYAANSDKITIFAGETILEEIKVKPYQQGKSYSSWAGRAQGKLRRAIAEHTTATHAHFDGHIFNAAGRATGKYIQKTV